MTLPVDYTSISREREGTFVVTMSINVIVPVLLSRYLRYEDSFVRAVDGLARARWNVT